MRISSSLSLGDLGWVDHGTLFHSGLPKGQRLRFWRKGYIWTGQTCQPMHRGHLDSWMGREIPDEGGSRQIIGGRVPRRSFSGHQQEESPFHPRCVLATWERVAMKVVHQH